jgi:ferrous iron transport protein A
VGEKRKEKMMPLSMANIGEENSIKKVGGREETRQFLANLGFIPGSHITIVTKNSGNVIVSIKESRVAVSQEMAAKIMVCGGASPLRGAVRFNLPLTRHI